MDRTIPPNPRNNKDVEKIKHINYKIEEILKDKNVDLNIREKLFYLQLFVKNYIEFYGIYSGCRNKQKIGFIMPSECDQFWEALLSLRGLPKLIEELYDHARYVSKGRGPVYYAFHPDKEKVKQNDTNELRKLEGKLRYHLSKANDLFSRNERIMVSKSKVLGWKKHGDADKIQKWRRQQQKAAVKG